MTDTSHACPCGCGAQIPHHQLACRTGWFRLPYDIRTDITSTYRRDPDAHIEAVAEALDWYREHPRPAPGTSTPRRR